jgi:2-haloacid dehalogenase
MVIVFDVNGTLLDVHALEPRFERMFGGQYSVDQWFTEVLQYSMAISLAGEFSDFGDIAAGVLEMGAAGRGVRLSRGDISQIRAGMESLPAFPDARGALGRMRSQGRRLAALSNSGESALKRQLRNAGLDDCFEQVLSAASVNRYEPAPEVYRFAAEMLHVPAHEILMVAAHPWDLLGAAKAGCRTALIRRYGAAPFPRLYEPDVIAADLDDLIENLPAPKRTISAVGTGSLTLIGLALFPLVSSVLAQRSKADPSRVEG